MAPAPKARRKGVSTNQRGQQTRVRKGGNRKDFEDKAECEDIRRQADDGYDDWVRMNLDFLQSEFGLAVPTWLTDSQPDTGGNSLCRGDTERVANTTPLPQSEAVKHAFFHVFQQPGFWAPTPLLTCNEGSGAVDFTNGSRS